MEQTINGVELADGTLLKADAGYADGNLWVWMRDAEDPDNNLIRLVELFSNPEKTAKIKYHSLGGVEQEWDGITKIITVIVDGDNIISVRLRRK